MFYWDLNGIAMKNNFDVVENYLLPHKKITTAIVKIRLTI